MNIFLILCSNPSDEEDEEANKPAISRPSQQKQCNGALLETIFSIKDEEDDLFAINALNKSIKSAIDNHSYLSDRLATQRTKLLKEKMKHALELAHQHSQIKLQHVLEQCRQSCTSATTVLHAKVNEVEDYLNSVREKVETMKKTCSDLEGTAANTVRKCREMLQEQETREMHHLSNLHGKIRTEFLDGLKYIFQHRQRMVPACTIAQHS